MIIDLGNEIENKEKNKWSNRSYGYGLGIVIVWNSNHNPVKNFLYKNIYKYTYICEHNINIYNYIRNMFIYIYTYLFVL